MSYILLLNIHLHTFKYIHTYTYISINMYVFSTKYYIMYVWINDAH